MGQKGKFSVAGIMVRHPIRKNLFVYSCSHAITGYFDEDKKIFTDRHGNEYQSVVDKDLIESSEPYAFSYVLEVDKLPQVIGKGLSIDEAITRFESICKQDVTLVGLKDGVPYSTTLNIPQLLEDLEQKEDDPREEDTSEKKNTIDNYAKVDSSAGKKQKLDKEKIEEIVMNIIDGKYSLQELKEMAEKLDEDYGEIDGLRETLKMEIISRDNNYEQPLNPLLADMTAALKCSPKINYAYDPCADVKLSKPQKIDIEDVFKKVTKTLIAQDDAARRVIVEIARKEMDSRRKQSGILLTGDTGVGKTKLMELIAKYLNRPFKKIDSTQLTIPGYVGKNIEEELWDLYVKCGCSKQKAENAIIFFDEIDKKGSSKKDDVSGQGVLNVLLPFIEGTTYAASESSKSSDRKVQIDTSNMIVILGGAFTDVYKNLIEKNGVGFNSEVSSEPKQRDAKVEDFVQLAMMPEEFMGRVTIVRLNSLTVDSIKKILTESDESAINIQKKIFGKLGVRLKITDGFIDEVSRQAEKRKTGARGLNNLVDEATWQAFGEVYQNPSEYEEVIIGEEALENPSNYQLVKRKKQATN